MLQRTCDILIVGGGVMGCSIAHALASHNAGKIVVLEKSYIGAGSSGKSGAIIRQHYSTPLTAQMAQFSLKTFERFDEIVGGPPVFTRTGLAIIVADKDRPALETNVLMQQGLGIKTKMVSQTELMTLDANVHLDDDEAACWEAEAGYVEAPQVLNSWMEAARRKGAEFCEGVEVEKLQVEKHRISGVQTNEGTISTRTVILTTGPWAAQLPQTVGIKLPVNACRTQVAYFRKPVGMNRRTATFGDFALGIYFKPTHGDMIHAGSIAGEEVHDVVDPDQYNEAADDAFLKNIRDRLTRRYPGMYRCHGRGGYGALYAITPDWHPVLDRLPGIEGAFAAVGFSGHGFKMSPCVGQLMSELIMDGLAKTFDISPLRYARFEENALIKVPHSYGVMG